MGSDGRGAGVLRTGGEAIDLRQPTFQRILSLIVGAILTLGRRTVTNVLWTMRGAIRGHPSSYNRELSRAPW